MPRKSYPSIAQLHEVLLRHSTPLPVTVNPMEKSPTVGPLLGLGCIFICREPILLKPLQSRIPTGLELVKLGPSG